jgi:hypothetical protein
MASNARLPDAAEGIGAFLEKRPASWPDTPGNRTRTT